MTDILRSRGAGFLGLTAAGTLSLGRDVLASLYRRALVQSSPIRALP